MHLLNPLIYDIRCFLGFKNGIALLRNFSLLGNIWGAPVLAQIFTMIKQNLLIRNVN